MSRRFSDEPINLIHRIPTPEQLSAARPSKQSFGQVLVEAGAACARGLTEVFAQVARIGRIAQTPMSPTAVSRAGQNEDLNVPVSETAERLNEGLVTSEVMHREVPPLRTEREGSPPKLAAMQTGVQPEEVAELRAFLLSQQQDIARLSAQIHELKSLVVSQQQVLVYLGKEMEAGSLSSMAAGIASAPAKRNRAVREKPGMKEKAIVRKDGPSPSSLSF